MLALVLVGGLALATVGIVRAQTTSPTTAAVDTQVTASTTTTDSTQSAPTDCSGRHQARLDELAKLFNMSTSDLQAELDSGKPMYQIAAEHGVTYDTMKASRLSELKTRLDDMVKVGYMTQDEADQIYQQAQTQSVNGGFGMGFGLGMHGLR